MAEANSSNTKSAPLPWILLSGFLGVFAVSPSIPGGSAPAPAVVKKAEEKKESEDAHTAGVSGRDPLKPIFDFYATQNYAWNPRDYLRKGQHGYDTEFMIATVPDPVDSPYGFAFDQVVDSIQRAIEKKDGYILDRSWLPWELDRRAPKPKDGEEARPLRERFPGVLLFRHGRDQKRNVTTPSLCVVFLVGETPLGGMHKRAFTEALHMMMLAGHREDEPVRVIGPYFSGTQTSLQFVVGDWWENRLDWYAGNPQYTFRVITGNASAVRKSDFFHLDQKDTAFGNWDARRIEFSSTVIPTRLTLNGILRFLSRRDGSSADERVDSQSGARLPGKVALLTESNTGFGKQFAAMGKDDSMLVLRFPLHISRVKSEFTQNFRRQDELKGLKHGDSLVPSIFEESAGVPEGIPSQGGSTTTAANGQVLANILATISKEKCRYVGVIASDTRDKLFLIRLVKEYCPDVQIFITEADMLLTHPDYRYHMRGVIVGSTYPLQPANQRWVQANSSERILFPSNGAQGYYNATLMHMGLPEHLLEYRPPAFTLNAMPAGSELQSSAASRPPIWVSVVAPNGSLVPLHLFTNYSDNSRYVATNPLPVESMEREPTPLYYPGSLVPFAIPLALFWGFLGFKGLFAPGGALFGACRDAAGLVLATPGLCYRNLILGVQCLVLVPLIGLAITQAQSHGMDTFTGAAVVAVLGSLLLALLAAMFRPLFPLRLSRAAWVAIYQREAHGRHRDRWMWLALNLAIYTVVIAFACLILLRYWIYGDDTRRTLFFIRAVDLGSGLSPLTPLVFMAVGFTLWAYFHLRRVDLVERHRVGVPYPQPLTEGERAIYAPIYHCDERLRAEVDHEHFLSRHGALIPLIVLGIGGGAYAVWQQSLPTIESWAWDALFFTGFTLLFALCVGTLFHLLSLWSHLRQLLDAIARVPMSRGFGKMPAKISEVFGKYLVTLTPHRSHLQYPAHHLRMLARTVQQDAEAPAALRAIPGQSEAIDGELLRLAALPGSPTRAEETALRDRFTAAAQDCLRALAPGWDTLGVDEAFGGPYGDAPAPTLAEALMAQNKPAPTPEPLWKTQAEGVVAAQVVLYLAQFFMHLRNLVWALLLSSTMLLLSATSYPFHPERLLLFCLLGLMGASVLGVLVVLVGMNRDEILSRIARTTPGKFSLDSGFIGSFFTYIVPTVGILAAQLSGSFRWALEPILRVLK